MSTRVCLTVDMEPDCPPYLQSTFRGMTFGAPALLDLLTEQSVSATCFATGDVAQRFPKVIQSFVENGHELGCHGHTHTAFDNLPTAEAHREIEQSTAVLRAFAPVRSFRAPYLRFPDRYLELLTANGITLDSSTAKYKHGFNRSAEVQGLTRIPASVTSSVLRLPAIVRNAWLMSLRDPVVLFVHPWEFVDLRQEQLRMDCRFRTGETALNCLREVIALFQNRGAEFVPMQALVAGLDA